MSAATSTAVRIFTACVSGRQSALFALTVLTVVPRLWLAFTAQYPGHGDPAFYYAAARNLAAGRGPTIDFVWHFLSEPQALTHYAFDLWMPLTSLIIALPFALFGPSMPAALLPGIAASLGIVLIAYGASLWIGATRDIAFIAAALVSLAPAVFDASLSSETTIYACLLAGAALWFTARSAHDPRWVALAGAAIGLAYVNRTDGVLLLPPIALAIWRWQSSRRLRAVAFLTGTFALIALPFWLMNYMYAGTPTSASGLKMMMVTQYEDLYAYGKDLSLQAWLAQGAVPVLDLRWRAVPRVVELLLDEVPALSLALAALGLFYFARTPGTEPEMRRRVSWLTMPLVLWIALSFLFYTLVAPHNGTKGALQHSVLAIAIFSTVLAVCLSRPVFAWAPAYYLLLALLALASGAGAWQRAVARVSAQNDVGEWQMRIGDYMEQIARADGETRELILMTRNPFEFSQATGRRSVQIPNNNLDTIYQVAQKYGAVYLYLPAPRAALQQIYDGSRSDARFEFRADVPDSNQKFFRIWPARGLSAPPTR